MSGQGAEGDVLMTLTSTEWLGALADAWDLGYAKAVRDEVPTTPLRRPGNPYRVTSPEATP